MHHFVELNRPLRSFGVEKKYINNIKIMKIVKINFNHKTFQVYTAVVGTYVYSVHKK